MNGCWCLPVQLNETTNPLTNPFEPCLSRRESRLHNYIASPRPASVLSVWFSVRTGSTGCLSISVSVSVASHHTTTRPNRAANSSLKRGRADVCHGSFLFRLRSRSVPCPGCLFSSNSIPEFHMRVRHCQCEIPEEKTQRRSFGTHRPTSLNDPMRIGANTFPA